LLAAEGDGDSSLGEPYREFNGGSLFASTVIRAFIGLSHLLTRMKNGNHIGEMIYRADDQSATSMQMPVE